MGCRRFLGSLGGGTRSISLAENLNFFRFNGQANALTLLGTSSSLR